MTTLLAALGHDIKKTKVWQYTKKERFFIGFVKKDRETENYSDKKVYNSYLNG